MKSISAGTILVCVLLAAGLHAQAQDNKSFANATADWLTYRSESMGIEFKYPKKWTLHESPGNSVGASFSFTSATGYQGDFILFNMGPARSSFEHFLKQSQKQLAKATRIPIGSEEGYEQDEFQCGQEHSNGPKGCAAWFDFQSPTLFSRGIDVNLQILVPYAQGRKLTSSPDPYLLFKEDVDRARQTLSTFKFTSQTP